MVINVQLERVLSLVLQNFKIMIGHNNNNQRPIIE